ncbi:MAG: hypothetical protein QF535_16785, partial [Anaerolineales bacterium]|nr:hypothetical protein [Anaerolineales bacterium]
APSPDPGHIEVGTGGVGTKILDREWPFESGLTAGTTKQEGRDPDLKESNTKSTVLEEEFKGLT